MRKYRIREHPDGVFEIQAYDRFLDWRSYKFEGLTTLKRAKKKLKEMKEYEIRLQQEPKYYY